MKLIFCFAANPPIRSTVRQAISRQGICQATVYKRIVVTAMFGLIHSFGFSFFLKEIGLGDQQFSLLFFNLGVEVG